MKRSLLAAFMMSGLMFQDFNRGIEPASLSPEAKERRSKEAKRRIAQSNGLTEFHYGSNSLWALNQKSADKKAKKKGWL